MHVLHINKVIDIFK